jgi:tetratricopeptide (TPR) repeat protein
MARVFLSYSRDEQAKAEALAEALERHEHEVWWDRHLEGGSRYASEIEEELKRADAVVVLWSQSSVRSAWVQDEAAEGRNSDRLVPVVLDDSQPPLGFRQFQAIDLSGWNGRSGAKALDAVHRAIASKASNGAKPVAVKPARRAPGLSRRFILAGGGALAVVAAASLYWLGSSGTAEPHALRVRLAPFTNLSPGIPQSVPHVLREEMLAAFGTDGLITATASDDKSGEQPTAYALAGSVRQVGDELRFTMHLTDEGSGDTLWTQMLKRPASSVDVAPRQVAIAASQILRCGLTGKAQYRGTLPDQTLAAYLSYCQEYMADSAGNVFNPTRALDLARRTVEMTPDFSRGWSARAWSAAYGTRHIQGGGAQAMQAEAEEAARQAIRFDPKNSQAYEVLASLKPRNSVEREKLHVQSVSVRPGDCGCEFVGYGGFLQNVGRLEDSADAFKRAHDMVPLSADVNAVYAVALFETGRTAEAKTIVDDLLEIWPNDPARELLVRTSFWTGNYDQALSALTDPRSHFSDAERRAYSAAVRAHHSGNGSQKASAVGLLKALASDESADRPILVTALAALGADREALSLAARLVGPNGSRDQYLLFEPPFVRIRHMPEFAALVGRIGLANYWRQSRRLPDFCRSSDAPALCRSLG